MTAVDAPSLQEQYLPGNVCFGCGADNPAGLGLRSFAADDGLTAIATWQPGIAHQAFPGVLCGGVIGTLIDCHSGAALALAVRRRDGGWPWSQGPAWATASFRVRLLRPAPVDRPLQLSARVRRLEEARAFVTATLQVDGVDHATGIAEWRRLRRAFAGLHGAA